jgi:nitronate monooxygenase
MMMVMTLSTAFTKLFGVRHPITLAPMGGTAGGELVAAGLVAGMAAQAEDALARAGRR